MSLGHDLAKNMRRAKGFCDDPRWTSYPKELTPFGQSAVGRRQALGGQGGVAPVWVILFGRILKLLVKKRAEQSVLFVQQIAQRA